ncbi:hypothetical protein Scep_019695 [Stephania cephalantha]|uniref:Nuclear pore protein n=1 Tax=Stephania cephalantha TaxID=152367 RepID=A0AAP0IB55_9MAGN
MMIKVVHEMAMVSAIQEAEKDNLRYFNDHMLQVLEVRGSAKGEGGFPAKLELIVTNPSLKKKAAVYGEVVRNLNSARERALPFKPATTFKTAHESMGLNMASTKSVSMLKIWHLIQTLVAENSAVQQNVSRKMSLVIGARRHLELGLEKYIMDTIQSHPLQGYLFVFGVAFVMNPDYVYTCTALPELLYTSKGLRGAGILMQIYFCLRTGYYDEARNIALSSRVSHQFAPQGTIEEWIRCNYGLPYTQDVPSSFKVSSKP